MIRPSSARKQVRPSTATTFRLPTNEASFVVTNRSPNVETRVRPSTANSIHRSSHYREQNYIQVCNARPSSTEPTFVITGSTSVSPVKKEKTAPKPLNIAQELPRSAPIVRRNIVTKPTPPVGANRVISPDIKENDNIPSNTSSPSPKPQFGVKGRISPMKLRARDSPPLSSRSGRGPLTSRFEPWTPTSHSPDRLASEDDIFDANDNINDFDWTERDALSYSPVGNKPTSPSKKLLKNGILMSVPRLSLRSLTSVESPVQTPRGGSMRNLHLHSPKSPPKTPTAVIDTHRSQIEIPLEPVEGEKAELTPREVVVRNVEKSEIRTMNDLVKDFFEKNYKNKSPGSPGTRKKRRKGKPGLDNGRDHKLMPADYGMLVRQIIKNGIIVEDLEEWQERLERLQLKYELMEDVDELFIADIRDLQEKFREMDLTEADAIKKIRNPPNIVRSVLEAVAILLNKDLNFSRDIQNLYTLVLEDTRSKLLDFDHETINERQMKELQRFVRDPKFKPSVIKYKYQIIATMCHFVNVMYKMRLAQPKIRLKRQIDAIAELIQLQIEMKHTIV